MMRDLLSEKLRSYAPENALEQERAVRDLMQHYVLAGLARAGLFKEAFFHGGTSLRILFGMSRFSEDLDFMLLRPRRAFRWQPYLDRVAETCAREGIDLELRDRSEVDGAVKKAFLKTDSVGKLVLLDLPFSRDQRARVRVKLEIDTNPPAGSKVESAFIRFPSTVGIAVQSLASGFATKSHALLCRSYVKGRDFYDLLWYVDRRVVPDLPLLQNALDQQGPWAGKGVEVTRSWYLDAMAARVASIDFAAARADVMPFVPSREQESVARWSQDLFSYQLRRLAEMWPEPGKGATRPKQGKRGASRSRPRRR